jgi:hypothetical protein
VRSGTVDFRPPERGSWRQLVTLVEPIEFEEVAPIVMMATRYDPDDFFPSNNNVTLTAVVVENRIAIAATNLSETPLEGLQVTWWAFRP